MSQPTVWSLFNDDEKEVLQIDGGNEAGVVSGKLQRP